VFVQNSINSRLHWHTEPEYATTPTLDWSYLFFGYDAIGGYWIDSDAEVRDSSYDDSKAISIFEDGADEETAKKQRDIQGKHKLDYSEVENEYASL
jgi:hypothetical protein